MLFNIITSYDDSIHLHKDLRRHERLWVCFWLSVRGLRVITQSSWIVNIGLVSLTYLGIKWSLRHVFLTFFSQMSIPFSFTCYFIIPVMLLLRPLQLTVILIVILVMTWPRARVLLRRVDVARIFWTVGASLIPEVSRRKRVVYCLIIYLLISFAYQFSSMLISSL